MSMSSGTQSVTDTVATLVSANTNRTKITIKNAGTDTVYIGWDNSVTDSDGVPIYANETYEDDSSQSAIYIICASGETATAHFFEEDLSGVN